MARLLVGLYPCDITDDIDGIDAALVSIEDKIDTVDTVVDGIVTDVAAVSGLVTTVDTVVDTLTTNLATVDTIVDAIKVVTDALAVLTESGGTLTTDGNEQNVYINNAPGGVYRPVCVKIDFTNHTATETVVIKTYYRITSGGDFIQQDEVEYAGVQDPLLIHVDLDSNRYGIKVTMEKTAGDNVAYIWEVVYEV